MTPPRALAVCTVQIGSVSFDELAQACQMSDFLTANNITAEDLPAAIQSSATAAVALCSAIVDLGANPTNQAIKDAVADMLDLSPPGAVWTAASVPGGTTSAQLCGQSADALCGIIQDTPGKRGAGIDGAGTCSVRCPVGSLRLWGKVTCD